MRLKDKVAIVVGAGQTRGDEIGNGRATAQLFAREGARLLLVDRDEIAAEETRRVIEDEGGKAHVVRADITSERKCRGVVAACLREYGRIDVLHNDVGIGTDDRGPTSLEEAAFDHIIDVNL